SEANDANPQLPEFAQPRAVERQQLDEFLCRRRGGLGCSVFGHCYLRIEQAGAWVRCFQISLAQVARDAPIQQVLVLQSEVRPGGHGQEMVEGVNAFERSPHLPDQAADAPKGELVAEPRTVAFIVRVTARAMPPQGGNRGIRERCRHGWSASRARAAFCSSS